MVSDHQSLDDKTKGITQISNPSLQTQEITVTPDDTLKGNLSSDVRQIARMSTTSLVSGISQGIIF